MRRSIINIAAIAAVVLSSCSREAIFPEQDGSRLPGELTPLTISTGEMTRTSLSGTAVNWSDDDQIAVFDDLHYNNEFDAVDVNGSVAVFEGMVRARTTDFYAVYPYSDAVEADAESIYVSLPSDQTPVSGTFAEEHNISVAHGTKTAEADVVDGIVFKNVCALVQFTVPQRLAEVAEVSFTANNRNIAGDLKVAKSDLGVTCTSGVNTVKMTGDFSAGSTFYFVVTPGEINGFSAKVTTKNGATYTKSSTKSFEANAGTIKNLGEIDFTISSSVEAKHYKDQNGVLQGTNVTLHLGFPDDMLLEYVQELDAVMYDSQGHEYRHLKSSNPSSSELMEVSLANTYIPQGVYKVDCTYTLNGKKTYMTLDVTVPAPDFKVSVSAYTSYNKYLERDLDAANYQCDPMKIYDIKFNVGISDDIIKQYGLESCSPQISISGNRRNISGTFDSTSRECFLCSEYTVDEWGTYQIVGEVKFDGVSVDIPITSMYITGLPYRSPNFRDTSVNIGGANNQYASTGTIEHWQGRGYQLYYFYYYLFGTSQKAGIFFSPSFALPYRTKVCYQYSACFFSGGVGSTTLNLYSGATFGRYLSKENSATLSRITSTNSPNIANYSTFESTTYMSTDSRIAFGTDEPSLNNGAENWVVLQYLNVLYAL